MKSTICHDFQSVDLLERPRLTPEKKVAYIELYHTLTLIFSQPQEVVNKYFWHNPHCDLVNAGKKRSHAIHWQDWILYSFMMLRLIFHTASIINRKNWRITTKLHFENISIFFLKSERTHMLGPPSPCSFLFTFQGPQLPSSTNILFECPLIKKQTTTKAVLQTERKRSYRG